MEEPRTGKDEIGDAQSHVHRVEKAAKIPALLVDDLGTEFEKDFGDIDLDGADLIAGAAERRGEGERLRVMHLHQLRGENGADGAGIYRAVGVADGMSVDLR